MLRNLVRAVFTIVGAMIGYGVFLLAKYLIEFSGLRNGSIFRVCRNYSEIARWIIIF